MSQTETSPSENQPSSRSFGPRMPKIYSRHPRVNFRKVWPRAFILSMVVLLIAGGAWGIRGLNLGIEFEGGVVWELSSSETSVSELRDALRPFGQATARIQELAGDTYRIRAEVELENAQEVSEISAALAEAAEIDRQDISFSAVGPSWGDDITSRARTALFVFFGVVAAYIWLRLEWRMTLAALIAVGHDIVITVGIYALFQWEVTPATLIAFLTILGYSLYDTLVVFDKVRENEALNERILYANLVSRSMNQVLVRSVNTTITSVIPVLALLIIGQFILGAVALSEFAIALLVGILAGTYSSIFVATPVIAWLKGREKERSQKELEMKEESVKRISQDLESDAVKPSKISPQRAKKGMLAQSKVRTAQRPMPRPPKKKKGKN